MQPHSSKWKTGIGALCGALIFGAVFFAFSSGASASTGNAICRAYGLVCDRIQSEQNGGAVPDINCETELSGMQGNDDVGFVKCLGSYDGQSPSRVSAPDIGECGNGVIDLQEQCDLGPQNNVVCEVGYNETCQYCSNQCQTVTVNSNAYCGNNALEFLQGETCDVVGGAPLAVVDRAVLDVQDQAAREGKFFLRNCPSVQDIKYDEPQTFGTISCPNSCQFNWQENCSHCGLVTGPGAIPSVSILNPLSRTGTPNYAEWANRQRIKFVMRTDNIWRRGIYQFDAPTRINRDGTMPLLSDDVLEFPDHPGQGKRLITAQQCSDRYALFFNERQISNVLDGLDGVNEDDRYSISELYRGEGADAGNTSLQQLAPVGTKPPYLGPFAYTVNKEGRTVNNDIIVSPALPPGQFRVVVKWTSAEHERGLKFPLYAYYSGGNGQWLNSVYSYYRAIQPADRFDCTATAKSDLGYWLPSGPNCTSKEGLYLHRDVHGTDTYSYAITLNTVSSQIDNDVHSGVYPAYSFFVGVTAAVNDNGEQVPIQRYKDADVTVEVYQYFPGQIPEYSLYPPVATFTLTAAQRSSNATAKFWHVFNVIKRGDGYAIEQVREGTPNDNGRIESSEPYPSGIIATDFDKIKDNLRAGVALNGVSPILQAVLENTYGGNNVMENVRNAISAGGGLGNLIQNSFNADALLREANNNGFVGVWQGPQAERADNAPIDISDRLQDQQEDRQNRHPLP